MQLTPDAYALLGLTATAVGTQTLFSCSGSSSAYDYIIVGAGSAGCTEGMASRSMSQPT